jgi:hypothetical protein
MKMTMAVLVSIVVTSVPGTAKSQMTLADLSQMCATTDPEGKAACRFYILGAFEGLKMAGAVEPAAKPPMKERSSNKQFCVPENLSQAEMVARVVQMASADQATFPEDSKMPAISFVGSVITTSYACR